MPISRRSSFGKKKRKITSKVIKKIPISLKKQATKYKLNLKIKINGKRIYKSEKLLKQQIKNKQKKKSKVKRHQTRRVRFGNLEVPGNMKPVSDFRKTNRPLLISPSGPSQPWLLPDETPAYSGVPSFGLKRRSRMGTLSGKRVNPAGYLSIWNGFPRTPPPSWNPLLLQGGNNFRTGVNDPMLSNVGFGRHRYS
jgi:hypothetical protein